MTPSQFSTDLDRSTVCDHLHDTLDPGSLRTTWLESLLSQS